MRKGVEKYTLTEQGLKSFLENAPLYQKVFIEPIRDFASHIPREIEIECNHLKCLRKQIYEDVDTKTRITKMVDKFTESFGNTTFAPGIGEIKVRTSPRTVYHFHYRCKVCDNTFFHCWVELTVPPLPPFDDFIRKVGQLPPFDISVPRELAKRLCNDIDLFKKANILVSQGYGIGACIYLRRVLEEQVNPILQILYETQKEEGATPEELKKIENAINMVVFEDKVKIINPQLPEGVNPKGINAVYLMYKRLSEGIHEHSDTDCIDIAHSVSDLLVEMTVGLREGLESKKRYLEQIKVLQKPLGDKKS